MQLPKLHFNRISEMDILLDAWQTQRSRNRSCHTLAIQIVDNKEESGVGQQAIIPAHLYDCLIKGLHSFPANLASLVITNSPRLFPHFVPDPNNGITFLHIFKYLWNYLCDRSCVLSSNVQKDSPVNHGTPAWPLTPVTDKLTLAHHTGSHGRWCLPKPLTSLIF